MNRSRTACGLPSGRRPANRTGRGPKAASALGGVARQAGRRIATASMGAGLIAAVLIGFLHHAAARTQTDTALDPTIGFERPFGLGGRSCKQYDDTGRLYIYSEGLPSQGVISWMQRSDNGMKANVPMPEELAAALPFIPGCMPGKHHAAS